MMILHTENSWVALEFELQMIQNEINRRHSRMDHKEDRARNLGKAAGLRGNRNEIKQKLATLGY